MQHRVKVVVVSREMQDGVDDNDVSEEIRKRVCFDGFDTKVVGRQVRGQAAHGEAELGIAADPALMVSDEMSETRGFRAVQAMLALPDPPTALLVASMISAADVATPSRSTR